METGLNRRESSSFGAMPSLNIPDLAKTKQDLPLPDSRISAFEPSLYGTIIPTALTLLAYVKENMSQQEIIIIIIIKVVLIIPTLAVANARLP